MIFSLASATDRPFKNSEFTSVPVATSENTCSCTETGLPATTSMMGRPNFLANSQSLSS